MRIFTECHYTPLSKKSGYTCTQRQRRATIDVRKTHVCAAMTIGRRHHDFDLCHDRFTRVLPMQHVSRLLLEINRQKRNQR